MSAWLLAHAASSGGGGGGGPNLLLMLAGLAAVAAGLGLRARPRVPQPAAWALLVAGVVVAVLGMVATTDQRPDVTLTLLSPDGGASVRADQPVRVAVDVKGGTVARSPTAPGGHLHLSVDGALEQMPYGTTAEVRFPRGTHTLRVEYVDDEHTSYDPPIAVEVRVHAS